MRKAIAILPVVSAIYPMITGATAPPTIVMISNEEVRYPDADTERINVPANPRHYWRYRMHITIEDLMQCTALNDRIRDMIGKSGRINN